MFNELYTFQEYLGTGSFGFVVSAKEVSTGEMLAIKVSQKPMSHIINRLLKQGRRT